MAYAAPCALLLVLLGSAVADQTATPDAAVAQKVRRLLDARRQPDGAPPARRLQLDGTVNMKTAGGLDYPNNFLQASSNGDDVFCASTGLAAAGSRSRFTVTRGSNGAEWYNIEVREGVSSGRRYLGTSPDGKQVSLWDRDDGSGRQRWIFSDEISLGAPILPFFFIQVAGGTSDEHKVFLTASQDGSDVFLDFFMQSGRQGWVLPKA